ncbi:MAG TPA: SRPBCC family protein [Ktedonobacterales bacterium]|nr:SRPBCC family protein [Ktedonobacterales bacterium]
MDISGTQQFTSSPQAVWDAFHNASILQSSIPGAQDVSWQGESALTLTIALPSVGPIGGTARAVTAQVVENTPPSHMKMTLNRGPVTATATVDLAPNGSGTALTYNAHAALSGPMGMADGLAKPIVEGQLKQFFANFQKQVG